MLKSGVGLNPCTVLMTKRRVSSQSTPRPVWSLAGARTRDVKSLEPFRPGHGQKVRRFACRAGSRRWRSSDSVRRPWR
jgi:hypothetical protein